MRAWDSQSQAFLKCHLYVQKWMQDKKSKYAPRCTKYERRGPNMNRVELRVPSLFLTQFLCGIALETIRIIYPSISLLLEHL